MSGTILRGTAIGAETSYVADPIMRATAVGVEVTYVIPPPAVRMTAIGVEVAWVPVDAPAARRRPHVMLIEE